MAVRLLLVVLMLVSLAMSASLPRAFEDLGLWVGGAYALQQIGRTLFMVIALRGHLERPRPARPFRIPPHPSGDGGGHHRLRGRRREGPGRPRRGCTCHYD